MFDIEAFVEQCRRAVLDEGDAPALAVKEALDRELAQADAVAAALTHDAGVTVLHRSDELTLLNVVVPAGLPPTLPHDHRMWAVVGIYGGQEDNEFFRRVEGGLEGRGGRSLRSGDTLAMGDDTIHAIANPLTHGSLAALHVYGGDLMAAGRSMWTRPDFVEAPFDDTKVIGQAIRQ